MLRNLGDLESEAYVFWTAVLDFRRAVRYGRPVDTEAFRVDMDVIHEMSDWLQIKMRCIDALIELPNMRRLA